MKKSVITLIPSQDFEKMANVNDQKELVSLLQNALLLALLEDKSLSKRQYDKISQKVNPHKQIRE